MCTSFETGVNPSNANRGVTSPHLQSCKRKILLCTGHEVMLRLAKKTKKPASDDHVVITKKSSAPANKENSEPTNKENSAPNRKVLTAVQPSPYKSPKKNNSNIEFKVNSMKVAELRDELKERGLPAVGKKLELRSRLLQRLLEESDEQQRPPSSESKKWQNVDLASPQRCEHQAAIPSNQKENVTDSDVTDEATKNQTHMTNAESMPNECNAETETQAKEDIKIIDLPQEVNLRPSAECTEKENRHEPPVVSDASDLPTAELNSIRDEAVGAMEYWKQLTKCTPGTMNGSHADQTNEKDGDTLAMSNRSPFRGIVKNAFKVFSNNPSKDLPVIGCNNSNDEAMTNEDVSPPCSEVSTGSKISGVKVRDLVSKISSSSSYQTSIGPNPAAVGSALSKSVQAKKEARMAKVEEARKARMAEIRSKVRIEQPNKIILQLKI